jgi:biotin carboxyl carrier protein
MKQFSFKISGNTYKVDIHSIDGNELSLSVNGEDYLVSLEGEQRKTPTITIPKTSVSQVPAEKRTAPTGGSGSGRIAAPLPGAVLKINVKAGDQVKSGDPVCILEAMKMQNEVMSPYSGTVKEVAVAEGQNVMEGDLLVTVEA